MQGGLTAALTIAEALANAETVEQALGLACEAVKREIGCPSVTAFVPRRAPDGTLEQYVVFDVDDKGHDIQGMSRAWGETLSGIALATGEQAIEGNAGSHGRRTWAGYGALHVRVGAAHADCDQRPGGRRDRHLRDAHTTPSGRATRC